MSFPIHLMVNDSEDIALTKVTTTITTLEGVLKEESSIMTPTVLLEYPVTSLAVCNYAYIPDFQRYYFITDVRSIRATLTEVSLRVDVLSTYAESIRACTGIVARQANKWNLYLDDGSFKTYSNPNVLTKAFPGEFPFHFSFILAVAGGGTLT